MRSSGLTRDTVPVRRELPLEKLQRDLVLRDIEAAFDDYVALLARTRPGPGTKGWRTRIRQRVDGLRDVQAAAGMLSSMLEALDEHEFGRAGEHHAS
jgi:hypothetical protein